MSEMDKNIILEVVELDKKADEIRVRAAEEAERLLQEAALRRERDQAEHEQRTAEAVKQIEERAGADREKQLAELRSASRKEEESVRNTPAAAIQRAVQAVLEKLKVPSA